MHWLVLHIFVAVATVSRTPQAATYYFNPNVSWDFETSVKDLLFNINAWLCEFIAFTLRWSRKSEYEFGA